MKQKKRCAPGLRTIVATLALILVVSLCVAPLTHVSATAAKMYRVKLIMLKGAKDNTNFMPVDYVREVSPTIQIENTTTKVRHPVSTESYTYDNDGLVTGPLPAGTYRIVYTPKSPLSIIRAEQKDASSDWRYTPLTDMTFELGDATTNSGWSRILVRHQSSLKIVKVYNPPDMDVEAAYNDDDAKALSNDLRDRRCPKTAKVDLSDGTTREINVSRPGFSYTVFDLQPPPYRSVLKTQSLDTPWDLEFAPTVYQSVSLRINLVPALTAPAGTKQVGYIYVNETFSRDKANVLWSKHLQSIELIEANGTPHPITEGVEMMDNQRVKEPTVRMALPVGVYHVKVKAKPGYEVFSVWSRDSKSVSIKDPGPRAPRPDWKAGTINWVYKANDGCYGESPESHNIFTLNVLKMNDVTLTLLSDTLTSSPGPGSLPYGTDVEVTVHPPKGQMLVKFLVNDVSIPIRSSRTRGRDDNAVIDNVYRFCLEANTKINAVYADEPVIAVDPNEHPTPREGYVRVLFTAQEHGRLVGDHAFDVKTGTSFDAIPVPKVDVDSGYRHKGWSPALPAPDTAVDNDATYEAVIESETPPTTETTAVPTTEPSTPGEPTGATSVAPSVSVSPAPSQPSQTTAKSPSKSLPETGESKASLWLGAAFIASALSLMVRRGLRRLKTP